MKKRLENLTPEAIRAGAGSWLRERLDLEPLTKFLAKKTVPVHRLSWIYLVGGAVLFLFALQVITGCLLMLYYQPTEATAHESVEKIMLQVPFGWLFRSIHAWGANLMIALACLHFLTVLFTRAYRKPREMTWFAGIFLLFLCLTSGFSGYLLPWNELAYHATQVGTEIPKAIPVIGEWMVRFLRGGEQVSGDTITRFFALHVAILPLVFGGLLLVHLVLVQVQGMSLPLGMAEREVKDRRPFFSEFLLIDAGLWLVLLGTLVTLAVFLPVEIGPKADALKPAPVGIRPEWYFLFLFKTLKLVPEALGVGLFALGAMFLVLLPLVDRNAAEGRKSPRLTALFLAMLTYVAAFEIWAWLEPVGEHPAEHLAAETYGISASAVSLALLWMVIVFLLVYLRQLLQVNTHIRQLYWEGACSRNPNDDPLPGSIPSS